MAITPALHTFPLAVSAAVAALAIPVFAEPLPGQDALHLDQMVITAAGFEQKLTDAPASISVITSEELRTRPYTTLLDAVRYLEGVDIGETRDKTGQGSVSMRGMGADYTLVLIDGRRQNNHGDIYPNGFGGNQFNHIPPLDAIERIEVIRGPAGTLYGADALGGVINVITKRHYDRWMGSATYGRSIQSDDSFGDDITMDFNVMGPVIPGKLGLAVRGSIYERLASSPEFESIADPAGEEHVRRLGFGGGGKTVDNTNKVLGMSLLFTPTERQLIRFDIDRSRQTYDNSPTYDIETGTINYPLGTLDNIESIWRTSGGKVQPRVGYSEDQEFTRDWWSLSHEGQWDFGTSTVALGWVDTNNNGRSMPFTVSERQLLQEMWDGAGEFEGLSVDERKAMAEQRFLPRRTRTLQSSQYTLDARLDIPVTDFFGDHILAMGGQYIDGELEDGVFGMESDATHGIQTHRMYSVFVENNWSPGEALTITAGVRYDDHDMFGGNVSPRLYGVYALTPAWTIKGGVSTGYKTPRTTDLYDGIIGFGGQGVSPWAGNPDLKPETSVNSEVALYWNHLTAGHNFNITVFRNDFEDKISRGDSVQSCTATGGQRPCVNLGAYDELGYETYGQSINIDKAEIFGVEVAGRYEVTDSLSLRGNYTWTDSEQKSGAQAGRPLGNTAEHMANATLNWRLTSDFNLFVVYEMRSDRYRGWDSVTDKARYWKNYDVFNLGTSYRVNEHVSVNARVDNLLDRDFTSYSTDFVDNGDGTWSPSFTDHYNNKDKARNFWVSVNLTF